MHYTYNHAKKLELIIAAPYPTVHCALPKPKQKLNTVQSRNSGQQNIGKLCIRGIHLKNGEKILLTQHSVIAKFYCKNNGQSKSRF